MTKKNPDVRHQAKLQIKSKPGTGETERPCMTCRQPFRSEGAHHRMCNACRRDADDTALYVGSSADRDISWTETAEERGARERVLGRSRGSFGHRGF